MRSIANIDKQMVVHNWLNNWREYTFFLDHERIYKLHCVIVCSTNMCLQQGPHSSETRGKETFLRCHQRWDRVPLHSALSRLQINLNILSAGPLQGKVNESGIQNIFHIKSWIKGHKIYLLGSLAESAQSRPNQLSFLIARFHALWSRILNKIYSEPPMHALSSCEGLI